MAKIKLDCSWHHREVALGALLFQGNPAEHSHSYQEKVQQVQSK